MKKKRIFISLALIASFSLASCDNDNTGSVTIDRGTTDASPSTIVLPEEVVGTGSTKPSGIDPVEVEPIDAPTNSYESEIVGEYKLLQANSGIGYKFLGWYNGDKLISTSDTFKVLLSEADYITPKFELTTGFEYLEFTSTDTECVVTGLKEGCPIDYTLPEGITEIASGAFDSANICFLTLPKSLKKIGDFAFSNSGIVRVTFNSVPEIGEDLFAKVMSIGSGGLLPIGYIGMVGDPVDYSNVPSHQYQNDLDLEVFMNVDTAEITEKFANAMQNICTPIESLADSCYSLIDDYLFEIYEGGVRLDRYYGEDTNLVLPDGPDDLISYSINEYAIPMNVESVKLSKKVDWICDNAFYNCYNLKTVELNEGLEGIGYDSFYYCTSLEEITIPSTVEEIDSSAFYNCSSLYTIYNYSNLEMYTYSAYGANPLEIITDNTSTSQVGLKNGFKYFIDTENNEVTLLEYVGSDKDIVIPTFDNYEIILTDGLFRYNKTIETVTLNEKVTSIGEYTFYGCSNLKSFDSMNLKSIGYSSFEDCTSLTSVELTNVEYIDSRAFANCTSLITVYFPKVETINSNCFENCDSIRQIVLPRTLTNIGYSAFYCRSLIEVINYSSLNLSIGSSNNGYVAYFAKNVISDPNDSKIYDAGEYYYYDDNGKKILIEIKDKSTKKLVINSDISSIALGALKGLQLEELELHMMDNFLGYYFGASYYASSSTYLPKTLTKVVLDDEITSIPEYAFYDCSSLENITIPSKANSIGSYAFYNCTSLKEIDIPKSVTYIGNNGFYNTGLEKIVLKEGLESVGYSTFACCESLTSASLPASLYTISDSMFNSCISLQSVKISEGTASIAYGAFQDCKSLYTVVIPSTLNEIQSSVFEGCTTIESISLKNTSVTSLSYNLFANCKNLVNLELPDTLTSINSTTFSGCDKLEGTVYKNGCYFGTADNPYRWLVKARTKTILECTVHPDCEKIYDGAFSSCYKLKKVVVPSTCTDFSYFLSGVTTLEYLELPYYDSSSVFSRLTGLSNDSIKNLQELVINGGTTIADKAFQNYTNLKSITLSSDITTIGKNAFEGTGLETFVASSNLSNINLQAFKDCKSLTSVDLTNMSIYTYSFSNGSSNSASTFEGCTSLTNVLLPTNLGGVASRMFYGCSALESITFPDKTTLVGTQAFAKTSIKSITWNKVTEVLKGAFYGTDIETITIPSGMKIEHGTSGYGVFENCKNLKTVIWNTNIINNYNGGNYAFRNCTSLTSFTMNSGQTLSEHMFENCTSLESIDTTSIKNYNQDCLKGSGIKSLTIPTGSKLQMYAFEGCPELTSVTIGSGVTFESGHTGFFKDCAKLTNVSLASDMTSIPNEMFKNCTSLSSFDFTNIKTINQSAFENTGFVTIELPSTITYIGSTAFQLCKKIEKVVINSNLSEGIFKNCVSLNDITFGENITSIPSSAFYGCKGLENITIPSTVTTIGHSSFRACGLTELIIPSTVTSVDAYAFEGNTKLTKLIINGICDADSAFYNCTSLKEVTIAEGNEKIASDMFWNCISLTTINLPDSLTTIDYRAFKDCVSLTSFTVPENVTSISSSSLGFAFDGCVNLIEIYNLSSLSITLGEKEANGGIGYYAKIIHTSKDESSSIVTDSNGYSFMYVDNKGYLIGYNGNSDELVLPESFEYNGNTISEYEIKPYSFYNNQNIKSIIISDSVTSIGEYAFYSCEELVNVVIGNNVKTIGEYAFYNCNKLIEVVMGNNVKTIGINAFYSCSSLLSITIPASVESIGSGAFSFCYRLAEIYNLSSISIVKGVSDDSNGNIAQYALIVHTSSGDKSVLVIDNGYVFAYIESENLGYVVGYIGNKDSIVIPGSFTYNGNTITNLKIKEAAFYYRSDLKSIIISDGINALGRNAFYGTSIDYLEVADGVEIDGYKPFQNAKIVKAKVPYNLVVDISTNYAGTSGLTEVIITCSETNKELASSALYGCTSLVSIVIPKEITYINYSAFARCSSLKNVYLEKAPNETMNYDEYGNSYYTDATKYYYSEEEPTDTTNLYWHYVDGEPTPW